MTKRSEVGWKVPRGVSKDSFREFAHANWMNLEWLNAEKLIKLYADSIPVDYSRQLRIYLSRICSALFGKLNRAGLIEKYNSQQWVKVL